MFMICHDPLIAPRSEKEVQITNPRLKFCAGVTTMLLLLQLIFYHLIWFLLSGNKESVSSCKKNKHWSAALLMISFFPPRNPIVSFFPSHPVLSFVSHEQTKEKRGKRMRIVSRKDVQLIRIISCDRHNLHYFMIVYSKLLSFTCFPSSLFNVKWLRDGRNE